MGGRAGNVKYHVTRVSDLPGLQVKAPMKACWTNLLASMNNLYFSTALVDRVHDAGCVIEMLPKRNFTLRNEVLGLKSGVGSKAVAVAEIAGRRLGDQTSTHQGYT
ncbi:hypothetical protein BHE74_00016286 [Ensete ventricosum]|nr:hypothetical protein GW17_00057910 [Ensete ventricosum]RWW75670.1 hypothetical protein BHE74_00016286 [Ensete ventricosum]